MSKRERSETATGRGRGEEGGTDSAEEDVSVISRTTGSPATAASSPSPAKDMARGVRSVLG